MCEILFAYRQLNMATVRNLDVTCDKFNVVEICRDAQKRVTKLNNYSFVLLIGLNI